MLMAKRSATTKCITFLATTWQEQQEKLLNALTRKNVFWCFPDLLTSECIVMEESGPEIINPGGHISFLTWRCCRLWTCVVFCIQVLTLEVLAVIRQENCCFVFLHLVYSHHWCVIIRRREQESRNVISSKISRISVLSLTPDIVLCRICTASTWKLRWVMICILSL